MNLPLADGDDATLARAVDCLKFLDVLFKLIEVVNTVIRNTDGADLAGLDALYECAPAVFAALWTSTMRPVDQYQVKVAELGLLKCFVDEGLDIVIP